MMRLSLIGLAALTVMSSAEAADWSVVVQPVEPRCAKWMRIAGAKQGVRVETDGGVKRFVCDRLTDGTATWRVKVVLEERATADGRVYTGRIENGEKGLRVVGFEGPFGKEVKIDPAAAALYVPDGLGRRVRTFPEDVQGLKPLPDAGQDWISHTWYAADDGRAMFTCGNYPGVSGMTMPWYTMTTGGRGVYAAVHDPEARPKHIRIRYDPRTRRCELGFEHMLFLSCGETWRLGETVFADYAGDWHVAAKKYRAWYDTVRTVGACCPAWTKEISGWLLCIMKQQNEALFWPYTDIPKLCDVAEANGLNCIGLFGWTKGGHDHLYPDYDPDPKMGGVEALKAGIAEAHRRGIRVFIYANGQLQQVGATRFWDEHGKHLALVRENGQLVVQNYHKYSDIPRYDFALGCLGAKPWYDRMLSLAGQAEGFGADAILYDQLGIFAPFACWGEGHGHAAPAYAYAAERPGFLRRLTDSIQKKNPNFAVLTEGLHDTILDSVGLLHGCETGTYPRVLADILGRATGGPAEVFPELWRYTFPELMTTVRVPCPMATRTMVNYAAAFGLRHDIELRYAPDRDWALEGKVPTREGYGTVRDVPDVRWMQANDPKRAAAYLKAVNLFQRKHTKYLLEGRFVDDEGFSLKAPAGVLAKRYVANDGTSAVLVWNMTSQSAVVSVGGLGVASETAEPDTGTVAADAPLAADALRLYVFGR